MNRFIVNPANENEIISIEGCRDEIKRLYKELNKAKAIIDKLKITIKNDMDGFMTINEHGESESILELLEIYLEILEDKEVSE